MFGILSRTIHDIENLIKENKKFKEIGIDDLFLIVSIPIFDALRLQIKNLYS